MVQRLRLVFEDPEGFREEYERNMSAGGAFVRTEHEFAMREQVEVEIALVFCSETLVLEAEVVHEMPGAVAVQFLEVTSELRARLQKYLVGSSAEQEPSRFEEGGLPAEVDAPILDLEPELEVEAEDTQPRLELQIDDELGGDDRVSPNGPAVERRSSPRVRASVPARLATSDFHLDGQTRDLSENGVLISADASEIPVGQQVTVRLQSPISGEQIEVRGRVSHHVESDGTVAAVGVKFDPSEGQAELLADFVEGVRVHAAQRKEAGISGQIEELGMPNLVQMLGNTSPQGTLIVTHGAEEGVIAFEGGLLRYTRLGALRGAKALSRLLAWEDGRFEFFSNVDLLDDEDAPQSLEAAILDAVRQMDERARLDGVPVAMTTTFRVDVEAQSPDLEGSKIEQAVLDLAEAGFTLRRLVDVIPESDAEILGAVNALVDLGILVPQE